LLVPGCLISLIKRELNIQTPCGTSLSVTIAKIPFLSSLLISLRRESVKGVSCTRTNISAGGDCFADVPAEVRWFSIIEFLRGRPQPRFIVGLVGSVGFWGTFGVGKGASSSSDLAVASGLSGLVVASSSFSLTLWVFLG